MIQQQGSFSITKPLFANSSLELVSYGGRRGGGVEESDKRLNMLKPYTSVEKNIREKSAVTLKSEYPKRK